MSGGRAKLASVGVAVALLVALLSVTAAAAATTQDPDVADIPIGKRGGTLRYSSFGSGPKTFNYYLAKETSSTDVLGRVFEGLVTADGRTTEIIPALAKKWEYSEDGLVWTFYLRRGVQWHDGQELTADDVIFSYDLVYDQNIPNNFRFGLTIDGKPLKYEKVDQYTVRFTLPRIYAPLSRSIGVPIMPRHLLYDAWKADKFNEMWGIDTDPKKIVGTGPFRIVEYVPAQRIVYERNPNYWRLDKAGTQLPYLDRLEETIVESQDVELLKFRAGEIDYLAPDRRYVADLQMEAASKGFRLINGGPTFGSEFIVFNQNPNTIKQPKLSWFTNKLFRQAVAYAVDKESIIDLAFAGLAQPQWSPIGPAAKVFHKPDVKQYPYDLKKAQELLAEAGFRRGADGRLRDADGNLVEFDLLTNAGNRARETIGSLLKEDLTRLGIKVNFQPIDFNVLVRKLTETYDWDAIIIGLTGGPEPATGRNVWMSNGGLHMWYPGQKQPATDWEARIDFLFEEATKYLDNDVRRKYYNEFQDLVADQLPLIYTVNPEAWYAVYNYVKNAQPTAFARGLLYQVDELWIERR